MQKITKILGIAPYEELRYAMENVGSTFSNILLNTYTGDLQEGKNLALEAIHNDYDIVISRGGTAELIRKNVSIPVIDVSISIYDILGAIKLANNYTSKFTIIGYSSITETAHLICDILDYSVEIYTIDDSSDTLGLLKSLMKKGIKLVLCDAITNKLALEISLNTILITSGSESIKRTFEQAIELNIHLQKLKLQNNLLTEAIENFKTDCLILSSQFELIYSSLDTEIHDSIYNYLLNKKDTSSFNESHTFYHSVNNTLYNLKVKISNKTNDIFYIVTVQKSVTPIMNSKFGVTYEDKSEVEQKLNNNLYKNPIITNDIYDKIKQINSNNSPIILLGERGIGKYIVSQSVFIRQNNNNNTMVTINSNLLNDTMWKHLLNTSNGPLLEVGNTIQFNHFDKISNENFEKLITIIESTNLHLNNRLIFICEKTSEGITSKFYKELMNRMNCISFLLPTLRERKNEIPAILTMFLNKVNIENNTDIIGFEPNALATLSQYNWPGNFEQLKQVLTELVCLSKSLYITSNNVNSILGKQKIVDNISYSEAGMNILFNGSKTLHEFNMDLIKLVLDQNNGNQSLTAEQLGISRTTLWRYLNK
ncbi:MULTISPECIES: sigma-54-dependent transcriptional regulator [unclassified Bacillus (in: firmicutes)]|uniref:sigma-54-dependent transcriptional regulator n=1 Tax=unclassified Bacillus (in: firmicutes) TaxID=185979 RepID=UPI00159677AD|nr:MULTISPECIES: sigma-54-dependent transcriptional regulator [unclassified Bacillus (in: firmicutes)]